MKKIYFALFLITICTIIIAIGQIFWKIGADKLVFNLTILNNYSLWIGFILYIIGTLLLIVSLRFGNLSLIHPFLSLSFIWTSLLAYFYLKETFPLMKIIGIGLIIFGTFYVFKGDK